MVHSPDPDDVGCSYRRKPTGKAGQKLIAPGGGGGGGRGGVGPGRRHAGVRCSSRRKPPGKAGQKLIEPGGWVSVGPVAGSEPSHQASQQYAGQRGRGILPPMLPDGAPTVKLD